MWGERIGHKSLQFYCRRSTRLWHIPPLTQLQEESYRLQQCNCGILLSTVTNSLLDKATQLRVGFLKVSQGCSRDKFAALLTYLGISIQKLALSTGDQFLRFPNLRYLVSHIGHPKLSHPKLVAVLKNVNVSHCSEYMPIYQENSITMDKYSTN